MYTQTQTRHKYTYINTYIHTHTYIRTHTYLHTYTHTYIYTYIHTNTQTHKHTNTHIHTYIHNYTHTIIRPLHDCKKRYRQMNTFEDPLRVMTNVPSSEHQETTPRSVLRCCCTCKNNKLPSFTFFIRDFFNISKHTKHISNFIGITISSNLIGSFNNLFFLNLTAKSFIRECPIIKCCYYTTVIGQFNKPITTWVSGYLTNQQQ